MIYVTLDHNNTNEDVSILNKNFKPFELVRYFELKKGKAVSPAIYGVLIPTETKSVFLLKRVHYPQCVSMVGRNCTLLDMAEFRTFYIEKDKVVDDFGIIILNKESAGYEDVYLP